MKGNNCEKTKIKVFLSCLSCLHIYETAHEDDPFTEETETNIFLFYFFYHKLTKYTHGRFKMKNLRQIRFGSLIPGLVLTKLRFK